LDLADAANEYSLLDAQLTTARGYLRNVVAIRIFPVLRLLLGRIQVGEGDFLAAFVSLRHQFYKCFAGIANDFLLTFRSTRAGAGLGHQLLEADLCVSFFRELLTVSLAGGIGKIELPCLADLTRGRPPLPFSDDRQHDLLMFKAHE